LDELEDEEDEEFLNSYRQSRMAELSTLSAASVHGSVYPLQKPDYSRDVTEASKEYYVLVHLTSSLASNLESRKLSDIWREAARKFPEIKFCEMRGEMAIEGYPEKNCPTILVYKDTDIRKQIVTLKAWGGVEKMNLKDVEGLLLEVGAVKITDFRLQRKVDKEEKVKSIKEGKRYGDDDDDDDWD